MDLELANASNPTSYRDRHIVKETNYLFKNERESIEYQEQLLGRNNPDYKKEPNQDCELDYFSLPAKFLLISFCTGKSITRTKK